MEKSKRVVGYARVSTEAQDITRQVELITAYCTERNYHLIKIIQEKISGARKDRKSINELLEVDDTVADMIIVSELSRLSREDDILSVLSTINELLKQGVDILFLDKQDRIYKAGTVLSLYDIITLSVEAKASADERYKIAGRMQTGLRSKLSEFTNMFTGGTVPFGYKVIHNPDYKLNLTPKNLLVVDAQEAEAVKYLFQQLIDGNTIRQTVRVYNKLYPYKLSYSGICRIIRNPKYKGEIYRRGKLYGQISELQIISPEDFDRANKQMRENELFQSNAPKYYNPLKGLIFCPCGCSLYMKPNHNSYLIYRCSSSYNDKQRCENFGIKCSYVLSAVWTCVKATLHTEEYLRFNSRRSNELHEINKQIRETITQKVNIADELKAQSAALIDKIKRLTNSVLIGELEAEYSFLQNQLKQTEQEIAELNGRIAENDAEIQKNVEQKDFSQMEQSALYKEKLQKVVYHSLSAMRGILEIIFKNGMIRYVLIKKHRNGGVFLLPEFWTVDISRAVIIIPTHPSVDPEHPYTLLPTIPREYTFDAIITERDMDEYRITVS